MPLECDQRAHRRAERRCARSAPSAEAAGSCAGPALAGAGGLLAGQEAHVRWRWFLNDTQRNRMADGRAATREEAMAGVPRGVRPRARQHDRQNGLRHQQRTMPTDSQLNLCSFARGRCAPHCACSPKARLPPSRPGPAKPPDPLRRLSRVCAAAPTIRATRQRGTLLLTRRFTAEDRRQCVDSESPEGGKAGAAGPRPLAIMAASADRYHILLTRERRLRIGRRQYRGTTLRLANPAANELAWLIAKLHADPAIDPRRSVDTRIPRQRRGRSKAHDAGNCAGNHDGCKNCPAHCDFSLKSRPIICRALRRICGGSAVHCPRRREAFPALEGIRPLCFDGMSHTLDRVLFVSSTCSGMKGATSACHQRKRRPQWAPSPLVAGRERRA